MSDAPERLSYQQKLEAISLRFYQGKKWTPKAGDYYTTSRSDLELYQVVAVEDGLVKTRYCDTSRSAAIASWPVDEFTDAGFGPKRVWVPDFVIAADLCTPAQSRADQESLAAALEVPEVKAMCHALLTWDAAHRTGKNEPLQVAFELGQSTLAAMKAPVK